MNLDTSTLNTTAGRAERFVDARTPRVREAANSALEAIKPVLAYAIPLARRVNWRMVTFGLVAGAAGYLIRSGIASVAERKARADSGKPHELNRWESEGGMVPTSVSDVSSEAATGRPVDARGDVGAGTGEPPLNS